MHSRRLVIPSLLLVALAGCGDDGGGGTPDPQAALSGTLAYVVTEYRVDADVATVSQELRVRQGEREPVTVAAIPPQVLDPEADVTVSDGLSNVLGRRVTIREAFEFIARVRLGPNTSVIGGAFQLVAVSQDGSRVAFEVTDQFTAVPDLLTPEKNGIFIVNADGSDLRRLGPASIVPSFERAFSTNRPWAGFNFSPDGRLLVFVDRGPGPGGEDSRQVWIQDVESGARTPLTDLPPLTQEIHEVAPNITCCAAFLDNETIVFESLLRPEGLGPPAPGQRPPFFYRVKTSGGQLEESRLLLIPPDITGLDDEFFVITGLQRDVVTLTMPGSSERSCPSDPFLASQATSLRDEVFLIDSTGFLQLTNYGLHRTGDSTLLSTDGTRVFFNASADPLGENPSAGCQVFSINVIGSDLRQVTHFSEVSTKGCREVSPKECGCWAGDFYQDPVTDTLVFWSSCDPKGTNPAGGQIFAMRPDGTGLRQLTNTRGRVIEADGTLVYEWPGPTRHSSIHRGRTIGN